MLERFSVTRQHSCAHFAALRFSLMEPIAYSTLTFLTAHRCVPMFRAPSGSREGPAVARSFRDREAHERHRTR